MAIVVITGTNTDVGKTFATTQLTRQLLGEGKSVAVVKPAQTGEPVGKGDLATVREVLANDPALAQALAQQQVEFFEYARYPEPLAPNLAARRAGMEQLDLAATADKLRALDTEYDIVLVEGAGGLLVRIADNWTIADLARDLGAPMLIVTSTGLGSLNLAELTVEAAQRRGITVLGLLGGSVPADPDLATSLNLEEFPVVAGVPLLGCYPQGAQGNCDVNVAPLLQLG